MSSVKYYCPYCTQTSSRKWNLEVHLQRRHQGMGEPVGSGQVKFAYDWRPHYKADPRKERPKMASHYSRRFDGAIFSYNDEMTTYKGGKRDYLGDILETLHKVTEIKRLTKELSPQYQQPLSWFTPAMNHVPVNYSEGFFEKLESTTFTPNTDPLRDYIVGLTCHVCTTCLSTVPLPLYGFKDYGKIVTSYHECNPLKAASSQRLSAQYKCSALRKLYALSTQTMKKAIQEWWLDGNNLYLVLVPLSTVAKNSYDYTPRLQGGYQWLSEVIMEERTVLNDKDLDELMLLTRGNTYASFSIRQGELVPHVQSYFMTLSKRPFLPFNFTIENPAP